MRYEFSKYVYEAIGYDDKMEAEYFGKEEKAAAAAKELKNKLNNSGVLKKMGYSQYEISDSHFPALKEGLSVYHKYCRQENREELAKRIFEKNYRKEKRISMVECLYVFFFLTDEKLYVGEYLELYKNLMRAADLSYEPETYAYVKDAVLYYVLKTNQGIDIWFPLMNNWYDNWEKSERYAADLKLSYEMDVKKLSFSRMQEVVKEGLNERTAEQATKDSLSKIDIFMQQLIQEENRKGKTEFDEVFPEEIIRSIQNTEVRRQWYFFRLLSLEIKRQIENVGICKKNCDLDGYSTVSKRKMSEAIRECWLEKGTGESGYPFKESWSMIAKTPTILKKCDRKSLKKALEKSRVKIQTIAREFNDYLDINREDDLDQEIYGDFTEQLRLIRRDLKKVEEEILFLREEERSEKETLEDRRKKLKEEEEELQERLKEKKNFSEKARAFAKKEIRLEMHGVDVDEINSKEPVFPDGGKLFRKLMTEDKKVSRELLLLTVLFIKAKGVKIGMNYVQNNVLYNSRFSREFKNTVFEQYFSSTFQKLEYKGSQEERKQTLKKATWEMEEQYLFEYCSEKGKNIAVLHEILLGKEID